MSGLEQLPQAFSNDQLTSQYKRAPDDANGPNAKRRKNEGPATPGLMGPPGSLQRRKDDGLDDGDPNDMFGSAGINLQDEERVMSTFEVPRRLGNNALNATASAPGDRIRQSDFLDLTTLRYMLHQSTQAHGLQRSEADIHGLLGLALKEKLAGLLTRMVVLAKHRAAPPPAGEAPMDDVGRTLRTIALREIQEEEKRRSIASVRRLELEARRKEEDPSGKKKESVSKSKLSDSAIARNANATAQMMMSTPGTKQYSWMSSSASPGLGQALPRRALGSNTPTSTSMPKTGANVFKAGSVEEHGIIVMKDFIGAMELDGEEAFGRGGRTLAKAYTMLKD